MGRLEWVHRVGGARAGQRDQGAMALAVVGGREVLL